MPSHAAATPPLIPPSTPPHSNPSRLINPSQRPPGEDPKSRRRKVCKACGLPINGQFVRALNSAYHVECFTCHSCGTQCSSKFFPDDIVENGVAVQVPLCEYDYFKKLSLICFNCDTALRGPYITALGNKYHLEHFKCFACGKVFGPDESYYEHENSIYCHFHYLRMFATRCQGCQFSIVKQFVELYKGGKNQQWHPECYMVNKFWNVSITPDCVGMQERFKLTNALLMSFLENDVDAAALLSVEARIEHVVMNCWMVLSGFEESAALCISEMLLCACTGKRTSGLVVTGKLIVYLGFLFQGLDSVQEKCLEYKPDGDLKGSLGEDFYSVDAFSYFQALRKEPRNISGKLMSYLAVLRKSNIHGSGSLSAELLSIITGCAHYLKLLIRIGLNNALKLNMLRGDTRALEEFLDAIRKVDSVEKATPQDTAAFVEAQLHLPLSATDTCNHCGKSVESACYRLRNLRWHPKCLQCSKCSRDVSAEYPLELFYADRADAVFCKDCVSGSLEKLNDFHGGFVHVSDLLQLMYLLQIAITRSSLAIKRSALGERKMSKIDEEGAAEEQGVEDYTRTLNDVTALRTKRETQKLSSSIKKNARKLVILEAPEAATATEDYAASPDQKRKVSSASTLSFTALQEDADHFNLGSSVKIQDEPPRGQGSSLDRTSDLLKNEKLLTLDDIPRIVAAEQAREQRPNAFKHHNSLYHKKLLVKEVGPGLRRVSEVLEPKTKAPKYYAELSKDEHFILRHIGVEALLAVSKRYSREELLGLIQTKKLPTFWDKFKFGLSEKGKQLNVFGVDLRYVTDKYGVKSDLGVGPSQLRIPIVVDEVISALKQKDMSVEGIFRLNGNIKNLRDLTEQINKSPLKLPPFENYSAVQLAALLKKWLRELPDPLLTCNLYDMWIASRREADVATCKRVLQIAYLMLPRSHRNLLEVLLYFFSWVASFAEIDEETGLKMDTHNLATVVAPNVLYLKAAATEAQGESYFLAIEVVNHLIDVHEELAVIPPDLWEFYQRCQFTKLDVSTKEIFVRVNKLLKEDPSYFTKFLAQEADTLPSHQNTIKRGQTKVHDAKLQD